MNDTNWRMKPLARAIALSSCWTLLVTGSAQLHAAPPANNALPKAAQAWVERGIAAQVINGNNLTINQGSNKVILNWESFNIGKDAAVQFNQPSAAAVALNRIGDGSASQIFGRLGANGTIYLVNNNGILFGAGSQVNVHGLVASTLNVDTEQFWNASITTAINDGKAALAGGTAANAAIVVQGATVDANGNRIAAASIKTDSGGQVLMFAPTVSNSGDIATPDGQTLLAASKNKVYLMVSDADDDLRGLLVEVDSGGTVENIGQIVAERGNITLLGLAVNQNGRVRATTSVDVNGSIRLIARDGASVASDGSSGSANRLKFMDAQFFDKESEVTKTTNGNYAIATHTGDVTFGAGSLTEVTGDSSGKKATDVAQQPQSRVQVMGKNIVLEGGAQIVAHSGKVDLVATDKPDQSPVRTQFPSGAGHIYLGSGSKIDVSGEKVELDASRRVVEVELRGDELKDAPLQRNGVLRGQKVKVDITKGSPLISDLTPWLNKVEKGVSERMTSAGTINLRSANDVVMAKNAAIDISGGSITYKEGLVATTKLISQGRIIDIGDANPNRVYDGILGQHVEYHPKWGKSIYGATSVFTVGENMPGYTDGKAGGTLQIDTRALYGFDLLNLSAGTTVGIRQLPLSKMPTGSKVAINVKHDADAVQNIVLEQLAQSADLSAQDVPVSVNNLYQPLYLSADMLNRSGLRELTLTTEGSLHVGPTTQLTLGAGSSFTATATKIDVDGKLRLPSGNVSLTAVPTQTAGSGFGNFPLHLGAGADIDVSGYWVNDALALRNGNTSGTPLALNGGSIKLEASGDVDLAAGARLRADAGAQLTREGAFNGGDGGSIELITKARTQANDGSVLRFAPDALSAYGFGKGGALKLTANAIAIGSVAADPRTLSLGADFFSRNGFSSYALNANMHGIDVAAGTQINLTQQNLLLTNTTLANVTGTGADLRQFASVVKLRDELRAPVDLTLSSDIAAANAMTQAPVRIGTGSRIVGEPGARVTIKGDDSIFIDGLLYAPGGNISVSLTARSGEQYRPGLMLWFGEHAQLLAPAALELRQNAANRLLADIYAAGSISVAALRGSIVAQPGSVFDVSGAAFAVDSPLLLNNRTLIGYRRLPVYAAAGALDFTAAESLLVYGSLLGRSYGNGLGGSLSFRLDGESRGGSPDNPYPVTAPILDVYAELPQWNSALAFGSAVPTALARRALVGVDRIAAGGFTRLELGAANVTNTSVVGGALAATGSIRFASNVQLSLADSLWLDATSIDIANRNVTLSAPSVLLGQDKDELTVAQKAPTPALGSGVLTIAARFIEMIGNLSIGGAAQTTLRSDGDIRLRALTKPETIDNTAVERQLAPAKLQVAGNLALGAAQIYPTTLSDYTIALTSPNSVFSTFRTGGRSPILSAGGKLTIDAPHIEHGGVLAAPLGQLVLGTSATASVHLLAGSVLDVSSAHLIPFGMLRGGDIDWIYPLDSRYPLVISAPPEKRVDIVADKVTMDAGATVNLSGGGDIYAYEFVPGPGGSKDFLSPENANGAFAIVPWLNSNISPYDAVQMRDAGIEVGQIIHLDGSALGLPAGDYAVLPAHYALLPGAYLITPTQAQWNPGQTGTTLDGTQVIAGRFGRAFTGQYSSQWQGFSIETGAAARLRSEYNESTGDQFFAGKGVDRAVDAGKMTIDVDTALALNGTIDAQTQNGRGAQLDIIASAIEVVDHATAGGNTVQIEAGALNRLGVDSLLLGGRRTRAGNDTNVAVTAQNVSVRGGVELAVPDLILAARNTVQLDAGAKITTTGQSSVATERFLLDGDGAFLRASAGAQADVVRGNVGGASGNLVIAQGATIAGSNSVLIDSTANMTLAGTLALKNGGSLNLTANRISLGAAPGNTGGVVFDSAELAALNASTLRLSSRNGIDFYGDIAFGNKAVELNAGALRSMGAGTTVISAVDTLQLSNTANAGGGAAAAASGNLQLSARRVELGSERDHNTAVDLKGFGNVQLGAAGVTQEIVGQGQFTVKGDGAFALVADRITANSGATTALSTTGAVSLMRASAAALTTAAPLGGSLSINAQRIAQGTTLDLAGGRIELTATGAGNTDNVDLLAGSVTSVAGRSIAAPQGWVSSDGGTIALRSANGSVNASNGSAVALGGGEHGGAGGALKIQADNGAVSWQAATDARSVTAGQGGSVDVAAAQLADFGGWLARVDSGGFDQSVRLRSGSGDLAIDRSVRANNIEISADGGNLTLAATLDASGAKGGQVALYARDDLTLASGSRIDAHATGVEARGGKVTLGTTTGTLRLQAGSAIDVSGGPSKAPADPDAVRGRDGRVQLRVPRIDNNTDVALVDDGVSISRAEAIVVEAVSGYTSTVLNSADAAWQQALAAATSFMGNVTAVKTRIGALALRGDFHLRPGIEVRSNGDLTVSGNTIDFSAIRFGSEPGVLTLRAAGNVKLQTSLVDGLVDDPTDLILFSQVPGQPANKLLMPGEAWQYRIAAGADLQSANPNAVKAGSGDIVLSDGADLITGAADIDLNAGGNIVANKIDSVIASLGLSPYVHYGDGPYAGVNLGGDLPDSGSIDAGALSVALLKRLMYPERGGDVTLRAGGDIRFAKADSTPAGGGHFFSDWMLRLAGGDLGALLKDYGSGFENISATTWGIWATYFAYGDQWEGGSSGAQGMAVLGGGDLHLEAGRDIVNLNAALPVTGKQKGDTGTMLSYDGQPVLYPTTNKVQIIGGGDLYATAGRNIESPRVLVDKGTLSLRAGGAIGNVDSSGLGALLGLADTLVRISARTDVGIAGVFNSTIMPQSELLNPTRGAAISTENYFFTYSDRAGLDVTSTGGDITLNRDTSAMLSTIAPRLANRTGSTTQADIWAMNLYPGSLALAALTGSIGLANSAGAGNTSAMVLFPTARGQLKLFAGNDIQAVGTGSTLLNMFDLPDSEMPDWAHPSNTWFEGGSTGSFDQGVAARFFGNVAPLFTRPEHAGDLDPIWISAGNDISDLKFTLPKQTRISAGRDIVDTNIAIQHADANSISEISAGRDISYSYNISQLGQLITTPDGISIAGPGRLDVIAGRDINLRIGAGIQSIGNTSNSLLPESGADLTVMAGINGLTAATDPALYAAFAARYFSAADNLPGSYIDWFGGGGFGGDNVALISVFTGRTYASKAEALQGFAQLPVLTRQAIALEAYRAQKDGALNVDVGAIAAYTAAGGYEPRYSAELVDFVSLDRFSGDLTKAVAAVTGQHYDDNRQAAAALALLPVAQQHAIARSALDAAPTVARRELVVETLMAEVRKGGVENAKSLFSQDARFAASDGFERSRTALALMFPGTGWKGSIDLAFSTIRSKTGGDINLLVPGGGIDVGLAGNLTGGRDADGIGIVTPLYGAINAVTLNNINVNQSRIFSLDAAPVTLWSTQGDIDAGKGAKTALSVKPPQRIFNPEDGSVRLVFPPSESGSGIQTAKALFKTAVDRGPLVYDDSGRFVAGGDSLTDRQHYARSLGKGDVYLFAPQGTVNAGDAGIAVSGNLILAAQQVIGADNISVGGVSVGVPTSSGVSSGTLSLGDVASSATATATNSMNEAIKQAAATLAEGNVAFVTVDIIGTGR